MAQTVTITAGITAYPLNILRIRMQMDAGRYQKVHGNVFDCARKIKAQEGMRGFFRGITFQTALGAGGAVALVFYSKFEDSFMGHD